ncbi:MAG TPA: 2-dehydropantoate 2-reductase [Acidobacteria bacterium]|nr:2-dehydropantoate 2-reductase [Acidobacteriota bacterium]
MTEAATSRPSALPNHTNTGISSTASSASKPAKLGNSAARAPCASSMRMTIHKITATDAPANTPIGAAHWPKSPSLKPMLGTHTVVVPLQNGVEATSHLMAALGSKPVIGGLCRIVASVTSPGRITHAGIEPTVIVGELDGSTSERVGLLRDLLSEAGVAVEVADDIQAALWEKFLLIAPWGGLGGLTRVTLDVLCGTPETRRLLAQSMGEVAAVAAAHGVRLVPDIVDRTMRFLAQVPAGGTASMQRDIMERRPSELEAQVGAIVRLGRDKSVDTPINTLVYECLLAGERIARGEA